jgi:hypothetical protein
MDERVDAESLPIIHSLGAKGFFLDPSEFDEAPGQSQCAKLPAVSHVVKPGAKRKRTLSASCASASTWSAAYEVCTAHVRTVC